jgi:energy-coupling factor transport system permease protein
MNRPVTSVLFIYALIISLLAYLYHELYDLLIIGVVNGILGIIYGYRYKLLWILLLLGLWGTFTNAYFISNTGPTVWVYGPIIIHWGAVEASIAITMRLLAIVGATLFFIGNTQPHIIVRDLTEELRLPKGIALALAYALRLIPLIRRDYEEVMISRIERGYRRIPYLPSDLKTLLTPLLNIAYERAIWTGIALELRGYRLRRIKYRRIRIGLPEILVFILLIIQVVAAIMI